MRYHHRLIEDQLNTYLTAFPVVGITGPRQSGKSTLLQHQLTDHYRYVTFDYQPNIDIFYHDPEKFIAEYDNKVIFDEVQKAPEIFNYIKLAVDKDRQNYGKYILTGSSQFAFIHKITESLAGRMGLLTLLPFQYLEVPKKLQQQSIYCGSYPELINRNYDNSAIWYASYLTTYLEKDVRMLSNIGEIRDFSRFISLLAANTSQLLNLSSYARDLGVAVSTVKRWISVLEASYIIFLLPPYFNNSGKRIIKSPKLYFIDTGLAAYLTRITSKELYEYGPMFGPIFENYIVSEIYKRSLLKTNYIQLCYYRTSHGEEVDLILDKGITKDLIEIKSGKSFKPAMVKQLPKLMKANDKGYLIYNGKTIPYDKQIKVLNYQDYFESDL